jgi:hypothetical protein
MLSSEQALNCSQVSHAHSADIGILAEPSVVAKTSYNDPINTNIQILDAATPGTLPVLDHRAVRLSTSTALALSCEVVSLSFLLYHVGRSLMIRTHGRHLIENTTSTMIYRPHTRSLSTIIPWLGRGAWQSHRGNMEVPGTWS